MYLQLLNKHTHNYDLFYSETTLYQVAVSLPVTRHPLGSFCISIVGTNGVSTDCHIFSRTRRLANLFIATAQLLDVGEVSVLVVSVTMLQTAQIGRVRYNSNITKLL